jgi:hypothetical protein
VISCIELESNSEMLCDEYVVIMASNAIDIPHHTGWLVKNLEVVAKEFLGPAADLMNRSIIFQNFLDGTAIAKPKKNWYPKGSSGFD